MSIERLELYSPLPLEVCAQRLTAALDLERWPFLRSASWRGRRPVVGEVKGNSIRLRKRISYNNGFQTFLIATMESSGRGTRISGEFGMHAATRIFFQVWFGGVILSEVIAAIITLANGFSGSFHHPVDAMAFVVPLLMLLFGFGLVRFGRYLARDEAGFLTQFLCEQLEATEQPSRIPD